MFIYASYSKQAGDSIILKDKIKLAITHTRTHARTHARTHTHMYQQKYAHWFWKSNLAFRKDFIITAVKKENKD